MEYAPSYNRQSGSKAPVLLLLFATLIGLMLFTMSHAMDRHGEDTVNAVCNAPSLKNMVNNSTGRSADICLLENGLYGVKVCDSDGCVVTAFLKEKMKSLEDVVRYLINRGYQ